MSNFIFKEKDDDTSWESIASLLRDAHMANQSKGFLMKTVNITAEQLKSKLELGRVYITLTSDNKLVGTASVVKEIGKKWYDRNQVVAFYVYGGVHPDFQGKGIATKLYFYREEYSKSINASIIRGGTAEKNAAQRKVLIKCGFIPIQLISNVGSDYYSVIYIKFLKKPAYPMWVYRLYYFYNYFLYKLKYKPGKVERCKLISLALKPFNI